MSWVKEYDHVDLAEMVHFVGLVNNAVIDREGNPARHEIQIRLNDDLKLHPSGELMHTNGTVLDPNAAVAAKIKELDELHAAARAYVARHGSQVRKAPAALAARR